MIFNPAIRPNPVTTANPMSHISRALGIAATLYCFSSSAPADIEQARQDFIKAEAALNRGDTTTWKQLQPGLVDYPLYADLLFKQAIKAVDKASDQQADAVLASLSNTPLQKTYLENRLRQLLNRRQWKGYIAQYQPGLGTRYQCAYARALYETGQHERSKPIARKLWLVGKSQIKECDPVFRQMKNAGQLTDELIRQRIKLAIQKGETDLVKHLIKSLPAERRKMAREWLDIRARPELVLAKRYTGSELPHRQMMLIYGLKRMALFEAGKALKAWNGIRDKVSLQDADRQQIESYLALRMTTQRLDGAIRQHRRIKAADNKSLEWAVRAALREQNWRAVGDFIGQMGELESLPDRWKYWRARQAAELDKPAIAEKLYHLLATGRGYHNFLAADKVKSPYLFNHRPLQYAKSELDTLQADLNVRRTHEFYLLNRISKARHEWYYLIKNHGDEGRQKLAYIQKQWGWHSQAILTIATADYDDDLSLRFPVIFKSEIEQATHKDGMDTAWVMALIRQESAFQANARSPAGARGLMQLMPATGRYVARLLKQHLPELRDLYGPEKNIQMGTYYLKRNLDRFKQNKALATAAYNAGPGRVTKWLPKSGSMDADIWAEIIPFRETRNYVQRIMSYASIYDHKLGYDITRVTQRMPTVGKNRQ